MLSKLGGGWVLWLAAASLTGCVPRNNLGGLFRSRVVLQGELGTGEASQKRQFRLPRVGLNGLEKPTREVLELVFLRKSGIFEYRLLMCDAFA